MPNRFCANCGAKLLSAANFCVECGERQASAKGRRAGLGYLTERYAPVFIVLAVLLIGGGAVLYGRLTPQAAPTVPRRDAPAPPAAGDSSGALPENHPPIAIPEQVKQTIREIVQKAAAAPDDMDLWKKAAEVQYRAGQLEPGYLSDAAAAYRHVLEHEPDNIDVMRALGNIAYDQQQPDLALDYYQRYLKKKPDDLEVQTDLGTMYLSNGQAQQALDVYEAVLKSDPSFFQAQFNLAIAYRSLGQNEKSTAALEKSRSMAPDDKTRAQVDQLLARAKGLPPPPAEAGNKAVAQAPQTPAAAPGGATFQAAAEQLFRQNPIMGPKVQRVEWTGPESAKVYLKDFPMDQMGPEMRAMFGERMKGRIKDQKAAHQVTQATSFALVDEASGRVMETIAE